MTSSITESTAISSTEEEKNTTEKTINKVILHPLLLRNKYPESVLTHCKSTMSKYLTEEVFNELSTLQTKNGFTLARAINTGIKNKQSLMGIHAGDIESYSTFGAIFQPVIKDYHHTTVHGQSMDSSKCLDVNLITDNINFNEMNKDILINSTRIRVARNIDGFSLSPGQINNVSEKIEIENLMKMLFNSKEFQEAYDGYFAGKYYSIIDMDDKQRQMFIDEHLLFGGADNDPMQTDSGYHLWWPYGRGLYLNHNRTFIVWVNEGDHIRIISMQKSSDVRNVFERLSQAILLIENAIPKITDGKHSGFMKTEKLGHITCCPTNLGTGLRASVHISLPKLCLKYELNILNEMVIDFKIQVRGFYGEHSEVKSNSILDVSNKCRMGYSEVQLVQTMIAGINHLISLENSL